MINNYRELYNEYVQKVKYPQHGKWCKESILKAIKNCGISDSEEYLITVFNLNSDLECLLECINCNVQFYENLLEVVWAGFMDVYIDRYEDMNKILAEKEYNEYTGFDILIDIINVRVEDTSMKLFDKALTEISVNGLREYILKKEV